MLCGLSIGLSVDDMRAMRVCDLENVVAESVAMGQSDDSGDAGGVRDATPADFAMLKGL